MKRTLAFKLLSGYISFGFIILFILTTFSEESIHTYLKKHEAQQLYREAASIADDFETNFSQTQLLPETREYPFCIQAALNLVGTYLDCDIWVADSSGNLYLDSSNSNVYLHALSGTPYSIPDFDISDFGNSYYRTGTFYGNFSEETMTVFSSITSSYKVKGYILIHRNVSDIIANADDIMDLLFYTVGLIYLCAFFMILLYIFLICRPLNKLTDAALQYAKGDFSQRIQISSNDEIGYLANTLNFMATELDTLEEEQKKFISNISHDFRSPLTSIKGYVEAMMDGTIPVEMQEKYMKIILFETERLNKLTQNILDLNRFGHRGIMLDISRFDINHMIRMITASFEGVCRQKGLSFDLILTGKELFVKADMSKIQQVLYNLIDNATKFSYNNTSILIETSVRNGKVFISVKDSGIGIPSESIKKIWERFYKTDLSRGKDKKGIGLGLVIVKEIVQAHNENINVVSTEDVGTEFIFTLALGEK
uniref:sensor histidine kinase n=1 Tax=Agathobacter sp. TaxID=2021311 RepID=UPI00405706EA